MERGTLEQIWVFYNKKDCRYSSLFLPTKVVGKTGRGDGIRTHDLCVPNAALYQTEPHLDIKI